MGQDFSSDVDVRVHNALVGVPVVLSDTTDVKIATDEDIDVYRDNRYCRGFHANEAGTLAVYYPGSTTSVPLTIVAGNYYPYAIRRFLVTGTDGALAVANAIIAMRQ